MTWIIIQLQKLLPVILSFHESVIWLIALAMLSSCLLLIFETIFKTIFMLWLLSLPTTPSVKTCFSVFIMLHGKSCTVLLWTFTPWCIYVHSTPPFFLLTLLQLNTKHPVAGWVMVIISTDWNSWMNPFRLRRKIREAALKKSSSVSSIDSSLTELGQLWIRLATRLFSMDE